ncbi:SRPBCC family protein [Streptomyces sp. c-19]|uniref:SRPBCC family protein n=1 Tax=Streptomyces sp. c-19 TaxID=2789275 RepID=UPI00397FB92F
MSRVEQTIDVDVPLRTVYDQWTQFEEFPRFMEGVEDVRQTDDRHCHWRTKVAGVRKEFDTEIVDQLPDERVSWRTVGGDVQQKGVVSFQPLDGEHTRVRLAMDVEADGVLEKAADAMGVLDRRVKGDLRRFKGFIEEQGRETGGWRGRIRPADAGTSAGGETGRSTPGAAMGEGPGPVPAEPGPKNMPTPGNERNAWPMPPGPEDPDPRAGM